MCCKFFSSFPSPSTMKNINSTGKKHAKIYKAMGNKRYRVNNCQQCGLKFKLIFTCCIKLVTDMYIATINAKIFKLIITVLGTLLYLGTEKRRGVNTFWDSWHRSLHTFNVVGHPCEIDERLKHELKKVVRSYQCKINGQFFSISLPTVPN